MSKEDIKDKESNESNDKPKRGKDVLKIAVLVLLLIGIGGTLYNVFSNKTEDVTQEEFFKKLESGDYSELKIANKVMPTGLVIDYIDKDENRGKIGILNTENNKDKLNDLSKKNKTELTFTEKSNLVESFFSLFSIVIYGAMFFFIAKTMAPEMFDKKKDVAKKMDIKFSDVAGKNEEKKELEDIISYFNNYDEYRERNINMPKGILLEGPPGTGKTLLAKALAGETNATFYSEVGSSFNGKLRGDGVQKVKSLFKNARENAPSIIFIDEIDALARVRGTTSNDKDADQTVNQLLSEMDGFNIDEELVLVVATTNLSDQLDPAVLRSGRFDRKVYVGLPNKSERYDTIRYYLNKINVDSQFNLNNIVEVTQGFSGADLELLVNEANIISFEKGLNYIDDHAMEVAFNKIVAGVEKTSTVYTEREKMIVAYHESGHAIVGKSIGAKELNKVTIIPHGRAGGFALFTPNEEKLIDTEVDLFNEMTVLLGGRAAEELFAGEKTSGVSQDLKEATNIARSYINNFGMTNSLIYREASDSKTEEIDREVDRLLHEALSRAKIILEENSQAVEVTARTLIKEETLNKEMIDKIWKLDLSEYDDVDLIIESL